ncbi:MAG TPA: hypothetical protein VK615_01515 [Candidatus Binatia bacterium]|nr:hypothetical protein [Candidatus Binatia bacterium]
MHAKYLIDRKTHRWSALLAGTAMAACATHAEAQEWTKHFRIGLQLALNVKAEFSTAATVNLATKPGVYDDGYVLPDGTGNDTTSNWGYDHASQFDGVSTMTFHRTESYSVNDTSSVTRDDNPYIGMELAYGGPILNWSHAFLGWEVGYSFLPIAISDKRSLSGSLVQTVAAHDTLGIQPPPEGYQGTPSTAAVIGLDPISSDTPGFDGTITGPRTLDVGLHNFRVGPTIHWEFAPRWALEGSAGGVLGLVAGDYRFKETITPFGGTGTTVRGKIDTTDVVFGGYVNGLVLFHVEEHGDIYAGVQFTSMTDSDFEKDGRSARLNLGAAFSFLIGVNWPF